MSRESLEKLREFVETERVYWIEHRDGLQGKGEKQLFDGLYSGHVSECEVVLAEIDRILAALQSEPTIEEAYRAGFDQGYCKGNNFDVHRPIEEYFADWLKQRAATNAAYESAAKELFPGAKQQKDER